jgi:hypothetical protein
LTSPARQEARDFRRALNPADRKTSRQSGVIPLRPPRSSVLTASQRLA